MEIYKDKTVSPEKRAKDLLEKMTVTEKINQMHVWLNIPPALKDAEKGQDFVPFGFMFNIKAISPSDIESLQRYAVEKSRLGIPIMFMGEGLHGLLHPNATVFPQSLGLSCSFDTELVNEIATEIGKMASAGGFNQLFAPDLDLVRDPRWGRVQETYGEDPFLVGELGSAYIEGLQSQGVAATIKHFLAHGTPESGLNLSSVHIGEREIREHMLPPFKKGLESGAMSVMPAYHELDGVPIHASKKWLRSVLRDELGFDGTTVSDWSGINMLQTMHHTAKDPLECGKQAIAAGVDIEAPDYFGYGDEFKAAIERGEIDIKLIDQAVYRILLLKFKLGLFDNPIVTPTEDFRTKESVSLAKKAADESIVLLKNDGILPLKGNEKIAVIGPNAKKMQLGDYTYPPKELDDDVYVNLYKGLQNVFGKDNVVYEKGCYIEKADEEMLSSAVKAAENSDIVVLALGDNSMFFGGVGWGDGDDKIGQAVTCGEGFDVNSLNLTEPQQMLFEKISSLGKKIVLVLLTGRPMAIVDEYNKSNAVIEAWYPGEQGGNALADIIVGKVNPSGRLSASFPRSTGHIPCNYNHRASARGCWYKNPGSKDAPGRDYVFDSPTAFLPFGFGLSYTEFIYGDLSVSIGDKITVSTNVKNIGKMDGDHIVLLFAKKHSCPIVPFVKELKAFTRISLKAGEEKPVTLSFDKSSLCYLDENYSPVDYSGFIDIMVEDKTITVEI